MRKVRTLAIAALLALGVLIPTAAPVAAAYTCPATGASDSIGSGNTYVLGYESTNYNSGAAPENAGIACFKAASGGGLNVPDFKQFAYTNISDPNSPPRCDGSLFPSWGTWNDCISSFKISIDCHHTVSFYLDANYGALAYSYSVSGTKASLPPGYDQAISSMKIGYKSVCSSSEPATAEFTLELG